MVTQPPLDKGHFVFFRLRIGFRLRFGSSILRAGLILGFFGRSLVLEEGVVPSRLGILLQESLSGALDSDVHIFRS